ncbi:putative dynactin 4 [Paratrimastix pyriformis]|uniref:Dynactin subunit 4 n=1 Tax=Paratrimastix pyriformis TaxID=342808 RepID=A0ABQ8UG48_9EUKA|nr:putative dynactin 4 [Paratrimastix pyriformis]
MTGHRFLQGGRRQRFGNLCLHANMSARTLVACSCQRLFPLSYLYLCNTCNKLVCPKCCAEEISSYFCPSCFEVLPAKQAQRYSHRCSRCAICPLCGSNLLASRATADSTHAAIAPAPTFIWACPTCEWTSEHLNITSTRPNGLAEQLLEMEVGPATERVQEITRAMAAHMQEVQREYELERQHRRYHMGGPHSHFTMDQMVAQLSQKSDRPAMHPVHTTLPLALSTTTTTSATTTSTIDGEDIPQPTSTPPPPPGGDDTDMLGEDMTSAWDSGVDGTGPQATTLAQRFGKSVNQARSPKDLLPQLVQLHPRLALRCAACQRAIVTPDPKPLGTRGFYLSAMATLPSFHVSRVTPSPAAATPSPDDAAPSPASPTLRITLELRLQNALRIPMQVTLQPPCSSNQLSLPPSSALFSLDASVLPAEPRRPSSPAAPTPGTGDVASPDLVPTLRLELPACEDYEGAPTTAPPVMASGGLAVLRRESGDVYLVDVPLVIEPKWISQGDQPRVVQFALSAEFQWTPQAQPAGKPQTETVAPALRTLSFKEGLEEIMSVQSPPTTPLDPNDPHLAEKRAKKEAKKQRLAQLTSMLATLENIAGATNGAGQPTSPPAAAMYTNSAPSPLAPPLPPPQLQPPPISTPLQSPHPKVGRNSCCRKDIDSLFLVNRSPFLCPVALSDCHDLHATSGILIGSDLSRFQRATQPASYSQEDEDDYDDGDDDSVNPQSAAAKVCAQHPPVCHHNQILFFFINGALFRT